MNNIKILYAEDDVSIIAFVKILFKKNNITDVTYVLNGIEALECYKKEKYDLVITDMIMPIMDGFKLIEEIKKINSKQIIMMVTALENKEDLIRAIDLRVNFFIEKPIKPQAFSKILKECIELINSEKDLIFSNLLLNQYKNAMDESTILSKVDLKGNIIYVNDAFIEISGYNIHELIGKPQSIIRHEDVESSVFKDLWDTVQAKKTWKGTLKNKAKDGTSYVVDAVIIPLLDSQGEIIEYIGIRHDVTELELYKDNLKNQLELAVNEVIDTQKEVVFTMGSIGETRSKETGNHVKRVAEYSYTLAKLANLSEHEAELLKLASPMHDIGKVGIPDYILNKPGKLTAEEFEIMKTHGELGYEMLQGSKREIMKTSAIVAYEHHERWDGNGYPRKLKGEDIHIYGRITSICDVFDALGSDRCYKKAWPLDKIIKLFDECAGSQFDPNLVKLFFDNLDKFLLIRDQYIDA